MPPSSFTASLIVARTLFSTVMSHFRAKARPPAAVRSMTVCCASRAERLNVIATSAPAAASASAEARPSRFAPPVISTVLPRSGLSCVAFMSTIVSSCVPIPVPRLILHLFGVSLRLLPVLCGQRLSRLKRCFVQPSCTLITVIDSVATIPLPKHDPVFTSMSQTLTQL